MADQSEIETVINYVTNTLNPSTINIEHPDGTKAVLMARPNGDKGIAIESLKGAFDQYRKKPEFRHGTAKFEDLASFIAHAKRFADKDSALFAAGSSTPTLTSVLDYHEAGPEGAPRFGKHRGVYAFPLSDEWQAWTQRNVKFMTQSEFAEFIENRILDISDPSGALDRAKEFSAALGCSFASPSKLIELSRGLAMRVDCKVQNATNLATGETQLQYVTQHTDELGAPLKVPSAFLITIPVFKTGSVYQIPARLRYRTRDAKISWFFELYRIDRVLDHAVREACTLAATETGLPLFYGSPE